MVGDRRLTQRVWYDSVSYASFYCTVTICNRKRFSPVACHNKQRGRTNRCHPYCLPGCCTFYLFMTWLLLFRNWKIPYSHIRLHIAQLGLQCFFQQCLRSFYYYQGYRNTWKQIWRSFYNRHQNAAVSQTVTLMSDDLKSVDHKRRNT